jgi:hypothetical protein
MTTFNPPKSTILPTQNNQGLTFPQDFGFYKTSRSGMVITHTKSSPPLFYISTHNSLLSSQPSVVLHSGPSPTTPALATADLHKFSRTIDIRTRTRTTSVSKSGLFALPLSFTFPVSGAPEQFEWRSSSGPEIAVLQGASRGMKLVRLSTGEVVAAWTGPHSGRKKVGKMRFMAGERAVFGDEFEILVVISIAAIMEKRRRANKGARQAGAGASFGGVAGAVGGP